MKKIIWLSLTLIMGVGTGWSLDKPKMELNIRKQLNLTTKQVIVVGDPEKSQFSCLLKVPVTIDGTSYPIYMKPDESEYFWGQVFDLRVDPDKLRQEKISVTSVHAQGASTAPVTIFEFTDLQCPYCSKAHKTMKEKLFVDYSKDKIYLVFKSFPLQMHEWAQPAAIVSECVAQQKPDSFWDITDAYFNGQEKTTKENFEETTKGYIAKLKIDSAKLEACRKDPAIVARVAKDHSEGESVGVSGPPTFLVNGRMLRGSRYEDLKVLIDEKLADKK